jgi:hypothetical protein
LSAAVGIQRRAIHDVFFQIEWPLGRRRSICQKARLGNASKGV